MCVDVFITRAASDFNLRYNLVCNLVFPGKCPSQCAILYRGLPGCGGFHHFPASLIFLLGYNRSIHIHYPTWTTTGSIRRWKGRGCWMLHPVVAAAAAAATRRQLVSSFLELSPRPPWQLWLSITVGTDCPRQFLVSLCCPYLCIFYLAGRGNFFNCFSHVLNRGLITKCCTTEWKCSVSGA